MSHETNQGQPITEMELVKGYREVNIAGKGAVRIYRPTALIKEEADLIYSAKRRALLVEKDPSKQIFTKKQLTNLLRESGDWTEADEQVIENLRTEYFNLELEKEGLAENLANAPEESRQDLEGRLEKMVDQIANSWNRLYEKIEERESMFADTIESYADADKRYFMIIKCAKDGDGKQIWAMIDDFKGEDFAVVIQMVREATKFWTESTSEASQTFFVPSPEEETTDSDGE